MDIEHIGKGCEVQPEDPRDFKFGAPLLGPEPVDWNAGFRLPEPPDENQNGSSSCVSHAWSYFHWQLKTKDWSRRSLYSRIFIPSGGAYLRDGGKELTTRGQATKDEGPDPIPQTESLMRIRDDITVEEEASDIEADYYDLGDNINNIAHAVRNFKGAVFGVNGDNAGWQDLDNPTPPQYREWGHALYAMGYHMHDGMKCIIAKSSWCTFSPRHHEHHIKENYFTTGNVYNCWVLIPKEQLMKVEFVKNESRDGEYGLLTTNPTGVFYVPASTEVDLKERAQSAGLQILKSDGSIDYTKARPIAL